MINVVVFILKGWLLVFVMMWVRWTLPRLRIDQVMMTCLKYLLPISCVLLLGVSLWQLLVLPAAGVGAVLHYVRRACLALCLVLRQGGDDGLASRADPAEHGRPIPGTAEPVRSRSDLVPRSPGNALSAWLRLALCRTRSRPSLASMRPRQSLGTRLHEVDGHMTCADLLFWILAALTGVAPSRWW